MYVRRCYRNFDIHPLVVPADATTTIEIRPRQIQCVATKYDVRYAPVDGYGSQASWDWPEAQTVTAQDRVLRFDVHFEGEQQHWIQISWKLSGGSERSEEFNLYSLKEDLFSRRPYKGDVHLHTCYSDGVSDPGFLTGACRNRGLDFICVTDHGMYGPSLKAIDTFEGAPIDLKLFPGEEVHLPHTRVHIVNFGGSESVNAGSSPFATGRGTRIPGSARGTPARNHLTSFSSRAPTFALQRRPQPPGCRRPLQALVVVIISSPLPVTCP